MKQTRKRKSSSARDEKLERTREAELIWSTIGKTLVSSQELNTVLTQVIQLLSRRMKVKSGSVFLRDTATDEIVFAKVLHGDTEKFASMHMKVGQGVVGWVVQTGQTAIVNQAPNDPRWYSNIDKETGFTTQNILCVPLIVKGEVIGAIELLNKLGGAFNEADQELLESIAAPIAIAVQNARLFEQVRAGRERMQALSRNLIQAQETERRHLAKELHDEIGQAMTGVHLNLQAIEADLLDESTRVHLRESIAAVELMLAQVRARSLDLRPSMLDDFGIVPALKWHINRQVQQSGIPIEFLCDPFDTRPPISIETTCFRVVQEALTNVIRHAHATHAHVKLKCSSSEVELVIQDDGAGFDLPQALDRAMNGASLGLLGMQERVATEGGRLEVNSHPGQGTIIRAVLPLDSAAPIVERRARRRRTR